MKQEYTSRLDKIESKLDFFGQAFGSVKTEIINRIKDDTEIANQSPIAYPER